MDKNRAITTTGIVRETLPNAMFQVDVEIGGKHHVVVAHVAGKARLQTVKMLPGDLVTLEISRYDLSRGRIIQRDRKERSR
ncbi:MAG: translation initiation factor IF-1 [Candidatus Neomarinimicrobiota bacterium]